jgi:hypothetical protein
MEADWDEVCSTTSPTAPRVSRARSARPTSCAAVTDCRVASHSSAAPTWAAPSCHADFHLCIRHDAGAAVDGQQPSEYVPQVAATYTSAYAGTGTRDLAIWSTTRALHVLPRPCHGRRPCQTVPLHRQRRPLHLKTERTLLAPPWLDTMAPDVRLAEWQRGRDTVC